MVHCDIYRFGQFYFSNTKLEPQKPIKIKLKPNIFTVFPQKDLSVYINLLLQGTIKWQVFPLWVGNHADGDGRGVEPRGGVEVRG